MRGHGRIANGGNTSTCVTPTKPPCHRQPPLSTPQALPHLTLLSLEGNRLSSLAPGTHLTGLRSLGLAANEFSELPEGLSACTRRARRPAPGGHVFM